MKAARRLAYHFFTEYKSPQNEGGGGRPATVPRTLCGWPSRRSNPVTRTAAANVVTTESDCALFFVSALFSGSLFARMTVADDNGGRRWQPLPAASFPIDLAMTPLRLTRPPSDGPLFHAVVFTSIIFLAALVCLLLIHLPRPSASWPDT